MLELRFGNMMEDFLGEKGISISQIEVLRDAVSFAHMQIAQRKWKELAFLDLVHQKTDVFKELALSIRESSDYFLLLGIGGSALGPKAIFEALKPFHNYLSTPKIFIYDNIDPRTLHYILQIIDPKKTTVNMVSKSGNTAETIASLMILWDQFEKQIGKSVYEKIILTTNPEKIIIKRLLEKHSFRTLSIPDNIVGRYSVLSAAGLLLSEIAGIDSSELLRGAEDIMNRCTSPEPWENPAYMFAILLYLMSTEEGRNINVMMPYADGLKSMSEWFCQLWAESLGKLGFGITPYPSVGTTDQHSQLQLWMEGPEDKVVIFVQINDYCIDIKIPPVFPDIEGFNHLAGHTLNDVIKAASEATKYVLSSASKPNMTIALPMLDAYHIGQLLLFLELSTAFLGFLFGVNPFNQPWVETGKNNIFNMLDDKGFQDEKNTMEEMKRTRVCWRL